MWIFAVVFLISLVIVFICTLLFVYFYKEDENIKHFESDLKKENYNNLCSKIKELEKEKEELSKERNKINEEFVSLYKNYEEFISQYKDNKDYHNKT